MGGWLRQCNSVTNDRAKTIHGWEFPVENRENMNSFFPVLRKMCRSHIKFVGFLTLGKCEGKITEILQMSVSTYAHSCYNEQFSQKRILTD